VTTDGTNTAAARLSSAEHSIRFPKSSPPRQISLSNHYEEHFMSRGFSPSSDWSKPFIKPTSWFFGHSIRLYHILGKKYSLTKLINDKSLKNRSRFTLLLLRNLHQKKRKPWFKLADFKSNNFK
jgi:hypothetical protein